MAPSFEKQLGLGMYQWGMGIYKQRNELKEDVKAWEVNATKICGI